MMGSLVIDERIYGIQSVALGEGAILAKICLSAAEAGRIPNEFDWSLHAADGSFVCGGHYAEVPGWPPNLRDDDAVELTLRLEIEGKIATQTKVHA